MDIDLDALEALAMAATPGPWYAKATDDQAFMNARYVAIEPGEFRHDHRRSMEAGRAPDDRVVAITLLQSPRLADIHDEKWDENTAYIAAASPDVVLALIARTRWLESELRLASYDMMMAGM